MSGIGKEQNIVAFMIKYYCAKNHKKEEIYKSCNNLIKYAHGKLNVCPFGEKKTSCLKCRIHCYLKSKREEIRIVMSYVGPRMIYLMPIQYVKHIFHTS